jgi:hypothetical protein
MARKMRYWISILRRAGAYEEKGSGSSHRKWAHPDIPNKLRIAYHKEGVDAKPYQENDIREFLAAIEEAKRKHK